MDMLMKNYLSFRHTKFTAVNSVSLFIVFTIEIWGQKAPSRIPPAVENGEDFTWWYVTLFALLIGLAGAVYWWLNGKKGQKKLAVESKQVTNAEKTWEIDTLDADKDLEWLRKNPKLVGKKASQKPRKKKIPSSLPTTETVLSVNGREVEENSPASEKASNLLPIFSIGRLEFARPFDNLPVSNDDALMDAIEQTQDELEEDDEIRDLSLRILAAFRTKNSVEALSQAALYDLSANLRSRAVTILSEFDHESVFETILLACADPTREVRAAAARGLTKLTFDRADAWTRIAETGEEGRVVQAARAAVESGFVDMSFDRLIHPDRKLAYEALTLMTLLINAGETGKIFNALENHSDMNVRKAVLHTIKVTKNQKALDGLYLMLEKNDLPIELQEEIDKTIEEIGFVTI